MHPLVDTPWAITPGGMELVRDVWLRRGEVSAAVREARAALGGAPMRNSAAMRKQGNCAIIPITGPLFRHAAMFSDISGARSYADIRADLGAAMEDPDVSAIVLQIHSPGGEFAGVDELADQIRAASAAKRVVAYAEGTCCSAAYWLAAAAGEVVVHRSAVVGSIGVITTLVDDSGAQEKLGTKTYQIVSSGAPGKRSEPVDDEVKARAMARVNAMAEIFTARVAWYRSTSAETVSKDYGGGDVMLGAASVAAGMADRLGSLDQVLAELAQREEQSMNGQQQGGAAGAPLPPASPAQTPSAAAPVDPTLAALLGTTDPVEMAAKVATLQQDKAQLEQLRAKLPGRKDQALAQARSRNLAPIQLAQLEQMAGDSAIPVEVVERCAATWKPPVERLVEGQTQEGAGRAEPHPAAKAVEEQLTAEDRAEFARCGIVSESEMKAAKASLAQARKERR